MKLAYVEWVDSHQGAGWSAVGDISPARSLRCCSVGWVISETKDAITLSANISEKNHPTALFQCCGVMTIPKRAIVKKEFLSISSCPELE